MYSYTRDHTLRLVRNPTPPPENMSDDPPRRDVIPEITMRDFLNLTALLLCHVSLTLYGIPTPFLLLRRITFK